MNHKPDVELEEARVALRVANIRIEEHNRETLLHEKKLKARIIAQDTTIRRLNALVTKLSRRSAELPCGVFEKGEFRARVLWLHGDAMLLADDLFDRVPAPLWKRRSFGKQRADLGVGDLTTTRKAANLGLKRPADWNVIRRSALVTAWEAPPILIAKALQIPHTATSITVIGRAAITRCRGASKAYRDWLADEVFPVVIERFGKGGAS